MARLGEALLVSASLFGCASTSGRDWLNSPIDERPPPAALEVAAVQGESEARPRLSHTITLGQTYADPATPAPGPAAPGVPAVQVNVPVTIHNYVGYGSAGYGYAAYGSYGYGTARASAGAVQSAGRSSGTGGSQPVGGNWPAVPDYGPKAMR
jgi:hypothetical protein